MMRALSGLSILELDPFCDRILLLALFGQLNSMVKLSIHFNRGCVDFHQAIRPEYSRIRAGSLRDSRRWDYRYKSPGCRCPSSTCVKYMRV